MKRTLEIAARAEIREARPALRKVVQKLENNTELGVAERRELTALLGNTMIARGMSPADIEEIMGPGAKKRIARQLLYRRYLEHWSYDTPVALWVTLDCRKGRDPVVRAIQLVSPEN